MRKLLFALLLISNLFANDYDFNVYTQKNLFKKLVTVQEAFDLRAKGLSVVDVRSKKEHDFRHVPGSFWIPIYYDNYGKRVFNKNFIDQIEQEFTTNKNTNLILISKRDARARYAANILAENGFTNIYVIKDGFLGKMGWVKSGYQYWRRDR